MGRMCRGNFTVTNPRRCRPPTPVPEAKLLRLDRPSTIVVDVPHLPSAKDTPRRLALGSPQLFALRSSRRLDQQPCAWAKRHSVSRLVCSYLYFVPEGDGDSQNERLAGAKEFAPRSLPARDIKRKGQHFARAIPAYSANGHRRVQLGDSPSMPARHIRSSRQGDLEGLAVSLRHAGPRDGSRSARKPLVLRPTS